MVQINGRYQTVFVYGSFHNGARYHLCDNYGNLFCGVQSNWMQSYGIIGFPNGDLSSITTDGFVEPGATFDDYIDCKHCNKYFKKISTMGSKIQWTGETWNFILGCTMAGKDCEKCYALRLSHRMASNPKVSDRYSGLTRKTESGQIQWTGKINFVPDALDKPLKRKKPTTYFINSMADFFHGNVSKDIQNKGWDIIRQCPQHTFQILTKRPENVVKSLPDFWDEINERVWIGVSVGDQETANVRLPKMWEWVDLVKTRFVSFEPLIGPIHLCDVPSLSFDTHDGAANWEYSFPFNWGIIGGESGNNNGQFAARPCKLDWINGLIDEMDGGPVGIFVKQMGRTLATELKLKDVSGGIIDEWPRNYKIRQLPFYL